MCRKATSFRAVLLPVLTFTIPLAAQTGELRPDWRHIGNAAVDMRLAGVVTGPTERVWFSDDGDTLYVRCKDGRVFSTADYEKWTPTAAAPPAASTDAAAQSLPESGARLRPAPSARLYAVGNSVWRSDNGGRSWNNLTVYRQQSILGDGLSDLAVSPVNPDNVAIASRFGVWHSADGGLTWSGMNENLPNLTVRRLLALPGGSRGLRIRAEGLGEVEWAPGEKLAWKPQPDLPVSPEAVVRQALSNSLGAAITAYGMSGDYLYAGASDGRLWGSTDGGRTWTAESAATGNPVEAIYVDQQEPRLALAALSGDAGSPRVLRTENAGLFWDDLTSNLPAGAVYGVAADRSSGAVYVATATGVWMTWSNLVAPSPATPWIAITAGLPAAPARDVRLDAGGNQLFVAVDGFGVYAAMAPHRMKDLRVVNSADFSQRAAAPGSLLTVLGARVQSARSGDRSIPVLDARTNESQLQVPFDAAGSLLPLALASATGAVSVGVPLRAVSPAIFVANGDGAPMVMDAENGLLLDAGNPARPGGRIQILATGLGRVRPDWPAGLAAPLENAPKVLAAVRVTLNGTVLEVTRATLAPGYVGFYLVEAQLPDLVNGGPAELVLEAGGQQSNPVRLYLLP